MKKTALIAYFLLLFSCVSCAQLAQQPQATPADFVLTNARVYTQDATQPWAQAVAVKAGRVLAVGSDAAVAKHISADTQVDDLAGGFVMPGIIDAHAHPAWGGVIALYDCVFPATATPTEVASTITACVASSDAQTLWIKGGLWAAEFFTEHQIDSPRRWLDQYSSDKAIALKDDSGHNYWVNSKVLELIGLTRNSVAPAGSKYGRDERGELDGVLWETSSALTDQMPGYSVQEYAAGVRYAVANANGYGVTGWKDASASLSEVQAYRRVDRAGNLNVHVAASLYVPPSEQTKVDVAAYVSMREEYATTNVHTGFVKIFLDGVPTTARTAAMVQPYVSEDPTALADFGSLHLSPAELLRALTELDAAGFTVKIHTAGDRSVHETLNAIEEVRRLNGNKERRHELAHAGFIVEADIPRFSELNVVADLSPHLWFPSPIIESVRIATGPRGFEYWPNRALLDARAPMLVGSDWPSVAPDLNPWIGMEAMITRRDPAGVYPETGWVEQALTLEEALKLFTIDGAQALGLAAETGSIEVGKLADLIVLNQDLTQVEAERISDTQVLATYFRGNRVYSAP